MEISHQLKYPLVLHHPLYLIIMCQINNNTKHGNMFMLINVNKHKIDINIWHPTIAWIMIKIDLIFLL